MLLLLPIMTKLNTYKVNIKDILILNTKLHQVDRSVNLHIEV